MEIHKAIADFSEDLVLAYLKEQSEAVGIPCEFTACYNDDDDCRYTYNSDDERIRAGYSDLDDPGNIASTSRENEAEVFSFVDERHLWLTSAGEKVSTQ
ncbi:hypothetical protein Hamer_G024593, partial [Homarus americanus]